MVRANTMNVSPADAPVSSFGRWLAADRQLHTTISLLEGVRNATVETELRARLEDHLEEVGAVASALTATLSAARGEDLRVIEQVYDGLLADVYEWASTFASEARAAVEEEAFPSATFLAEITGLAALERQTWLAADAFALRDELAGAAEPRLCRALTSLGAALATQRRPRSVRHLRAA